MSYRHRDLHAEADHQEAKVDQLHAQFVEIDNKIYAMDSEITELSIECSSEMEELDFLEQGRSSPTRSEEEQARITKRLDKIREKIDRCKNRIHKLEKVKARSIEKKAQLKKQLAQITKQKA